MALNPGIILKIGGIDHVVPTLSLGALEKYQAGLAGFLAGSGGAFEGAGVVIDATFAALKRNYPDITRETVAEGIDLGSMADFATAILDIGGQKRKRLEAEASAAPVAKQE